MIHDRQLLREFLDGGSSRAMEELIERHLPMVFSSAVRQVQDRHLAQDVTQAVFLLLFQKARSIRKDEAVAGWLMAVTRSAAINLMRKRATNVRHEKLVARPECLAPENGWDDISPLLDKELNRLRQSDRDVIVLRYFEDRSFVQIGQELGLSDEAARKRVTRALDRLRSRFKKNGIVVAAGALAVALGANAAKANSTTLTAGAIAECVGHPTPQSLSLANGAWNMLPKAKVKIASAVSATLLAATGLAIAAHYNSVKLGGSGPIPGQAQAAPAVVHGGVVIDMDAPQSVPPTGQTGQTGVTRVAVGGEAGLGTVNFRPTGEMGATKFITIGPKSGQ